MGRKPVPKRMQKKRSSFTISKGVLQRLDEVLKKSNQTRSQFIDKLLRFVLFNDKAYAKFKIKELEREIAYWEYQETLVEIGKEREESLENWK